MNQNSSTFNFKRYLLLTLLFTLLLVGAMAWATEWLLRAQVVPNDALTQHVEFLRRAGNATVAFGDSHVAFGVQGSEAIINTGYPGDNLDNILFKVDWFLDKGTLRRAVVQADPHMFARYREETLVDYDALLHWDPDSLRQLVLFRKNYRGKILDYWRVYLATGQLRSNNEFDPRYGGLTRNIDWSYTPEAIKQAKVRARVNQHQIPADLDAQPAVAQYRDMVQKLVDAGVEVCLVAFPVSAQYLDYLEQQPGYEAAFDWFRALAERVDAHFFRYNTLYRDRDDYFMDSDHLNGTSKGPFTRKMLDDCFADSTAAM